MTNKKKLNGKRFYVFTDGLSESLDEKNKELGIAGAKGIINRNFNSVVKVELTNISKEVVDKSRKKILSDDLTIVTIGK